MHQSHVLKKSVDIKPEVTVNSSAPGSSNSTVPSAARGTATDSSDDEDDGGEHKKPPADRRALEVPRPKMPIGLVLSLGVLFRINW